VLKAVEDRLAENDKIKIVTREDIINNGKGRGTIKEEVSEEEHPEAYLKSVHKSASD
jgi:hypothetical protein